MTNSVVGKFGSRYYLFDSTSDHNKAMSLYAKPSTFPVGFEQDMIDEGINFGLWDPNDPDGDRLNPNPDRGMGIRGFYYD